MELTVENGKVSLVKVNMGQPELEAAKIPMIYKKEKVISQPLGVNDDVYEVTAVSMGNPHAVVYMDEIEKLEIEKIGPYLKSIPGISGRRKYRSLYMSLMKIR